MLCCDNDDDDDAVNKHAATEVQTINSSVTNLRDDSTIYNFKANHSQVVVDLVVANFVQDFAINVDVTFNE